MHRIPFKVKLESQSSEFGNARGTALVFALVVSLATPFTAEAQLKVPAAPATSAPTVPAAPPTVPATPSSAVTAGENVAATRVLVNKVNLPQLSEVMAIVHRDLRASIPSQILREVGRRAGYSPRWAPGNPDWDRAAVILHDALANDEKLHGLYFAISREEVADAIALPWNAIEMQYLIAEVDTEMGHQTIRQIDSTAALTMIEGFRATPDVTPESAKALNVLFDRDTKIKGEADARVKVLSERDPAEAHRLNVVLHKMEAQQVLGMVSIGMPQSVARITAVSEARGAELQAVFDHFKSTEPAAPPRSMSSPPTPTTMPAPTPDPNDAPK